MTTGRAVDRARDTLSAAGVDDPLFDTLCLMCLATGLDKAALLAEPDRELTEAEQRDFDAAIARRCMREPLQHIIGTAPFMDFYVFVSRAVLTPRPETETLAEVFCANEPDQDIKVLDLGTGSGCIAIALSLAGYGSVAASDISRNALMKARENAIALGADIAFYEADLFEGIHDRFDAIISNPPYIPSGEIEGLMREVRDFDPREALDGGEDGLYFYRRIASECGSVLSPGGRLYLELGSGQAGAVRDILAAEGFDDIAAFPDLSGTARVMRAVRTLQRSTL